MTPAARLRAGLRGRTVERLGRRGFVSSRLGDPTPQRRGRPKKFYQLEPAGADALTRSYTAFTEMTKGIRPKLADLASQTDASGK